MCALVLQEFPENSFFMIGFMLVLLTLSQLYKLVIAPLVKLSIDSPFPMDVAFTVALPFAMKLACDSTGFPQDNAVVSALPLDAIIGVLMLIGFGGLVQACVSTRETTSVKTYGSKPTLRREQASLIIVELAFSVLCLAVSWSLWDEAPDAAKSLLVGCLTLLATLLFGSESVHDFGRAVFLGALLLSLTQLALVSSYQDVGSEAPIEAPIVKEGYSELMMDPVSNRQYRISDGCVDVYDNCDAESSCGSRFLSKKCVRTCGNCPPVYEDGLA